MKALKSMFKIRQLLLIGALCTVFFSCKDDAGEPAKLSPETEAANAVTKSLSINGAVLKSGTPPAPSTSSSAPQLAAGIDETQAFPGKSVNLFIEPQRGTVAGVYLKVKDSDTYYDIPASSLRGWGGASPAEGLRIQSKSKKRGVDFSMREKQTEDGVLEVELPENMKPGKFCVQYCVYDSDNRVSNIVEVCIEVMAFGGANSEFLTQQPWSMVSHYEIEEGQKEEYLIGQPEVYTYTQTIYCNDGSTKNLEVEEHYRMDYYYFTFSASGGLYAEEKYYERWMDYSATTCEAGVVYEESEGIWDMTGAWSYNSTTKELVLLFVYEDEDYYETYPVKFQTEVKDNLLYLKGTEDGEEFGAVFKIK